MSIRKFSMAIFVSLIALSFAFNAIGQTPAGIKKITSVEGITEYRLDNGLKVLLFPDNTKQTITVNITYLVGSKHENYGETGMAHLLEHLVFKGTPNHPDIPAELSSHGARPNGTTWTDRTNYYETFQATDENLNWALDLEADRMINSYIAKKDLDSEFSVVRNELESGENSPFRVLFQRSLALAFDWHNYGKSTIGARSDLENVPIDRLQAFYKKYYQPDNSVLLVAGKFDEVKTLGLIKKYFAPIPKPTRKLQKFYTEEPTQDGERTVTVRRVGDIKMLMTGYHTPPGSHSEAPAVEIFNTVMSDTPAGRLYKNVVEAKKATSIFGLNFQFKEPGYLAFGAQVDKADEIAPAQAAVISTLEGVGEKPITKEEVDRAKVQLLKNIDLALTDPNRVGLELSESIAQGDWRLYFLYRDGLEKVTEKEVNAAAAKYFKRSNRTVAQFIPTEKPNRAEVPNVKESDVTAMVKDYKGREAVAAGEAFDSSPANIESRLIRTNIGGLKAAFLTKENRGDTVVANLRFRFGDEKSLMNRAQTANIVGQMLMRGTAKRTRQGIQDKFNRLKARVNVSGGSTSASASIQTTRENLPEVMKLVAEILREPAFPEKEFDQIIKANLTNIESQRSNPQAVAIQAMSRHFNVYKRGHPRYTSTLDEDIEDIKAITLEGVKKFYKDFYGASNGELTVVGDFDKNQIETLTKQLFGSWKSPRTYSRIKTGFNDIKPIDQIKETPDKANAFFVTRVNLNINDKDPDYPALVMGNYMFGGGFLNSRFMTRIRQKDGISYGGGSQLSAGSLDPTGRFLSFAIYAPENVSKLDIAFKEEIARVLKDGFTDKEVAEAKKGWLQQRQGSRSSDGPLSRQINSYLFLDRTIAWDAAFERQVEGLTAAKVNAAMRKHITPDKISVFKAGDFAKAKKAKATSSAVKPAAASGEYADIVGNYSGQQIRSVKISNKEGKLFAAIPGAPPIELKPVKDKKNEFTAQFGGQGSAEVKFIKTDTGTTMNLTIAGNTVSAKKTD